MTTLQKDIIEKLLLGYTIHGNAHYGYRLRTPDAIVYRKFYDKTFSQIKPLLRRKKNLWVINKNLVRQLHGNSFEKRKYKALCTSTL